MWETVSLLGLQMTAAGWFLAWHEPGEMLRPSEVHIRLISEAGDTLWRFDHFLPTFKPLDELSFFATDSVLLVGFLATANTPGRNERCTRMFIWKISYPEGTFERLIPEISPQGCPSGNWGFWRVPASFHAVQTHGHIIAIINGYEVFGGDPGEVWQGSFLWTRDSTLSFTPASAINRPALLGNRFWVLTDHPALRFSVAEGQVVWLDTLLINWGNDNVLFPWSPVGVLDGRWVFALGQRKLLRLDDWNPENFQIIPVIPGNEPPFAEGDFIQGPKATLCGVVRRASELWLVRLDTSGVQALSPTGFAGTSPRIAPHPKGGFWLAYWDGTQIQHAWINPACNTAVPLIPRRLAPTAERNVSLPHRPPEFTVDLLGRRVRKPSRFGVVFQGGTRRLVLR